MTTIAITGAAGRMGLRLIALAKEDSDLQVVAAIERADHPAQGLDAGELAGVGNAGVRVATDLSQNPRVLIDFSAPASTRQWLETCRQRQIAMLIGTTGLSDDDQVAIDLASHDIAVLQSPNMSLGVNLLFKVAADVAKRLGDDYDIEIVEAHHRFKQDAPSGTAMGLADSILKATGKSRDVLTYGREGHDAQRQPGEITLHSMRLGDEVGRHTVYLATQGERLELSHVATSRDTFVRGALRATKWLSTRKPGRYTIADVLGL